jgi:hypothetical protein
MRKRRIGLALAAPLALGWLAVSAGAGGQHGSRRLLVYEIHRPGLEVSVTRRGNHVIRASVGAQGICSNGERVPIGFALVAGRGWPIDKRGRFDARRTIRGIFRGRFDGGRVLGVYRQSYRRNVSGESLEPTCGNVRPSGQVQRFRAWLVERDGHKVRHPAIWVKRTR